jgi:NAD(P)-dependent dehydrogenase (short-subunit alcohol dehydrogenase family)
MTLHLDINSAERTSEALADAIAVQVDVADEVSSDSLMEQAVAQYGRVDAIVTCAGIQVHGDSTDYPGTAEGSILYSTPPASSSWRPAAP